jgi:tetratricopeptide (TPR) repeat protein
MGRYDDAATHVEEALRTNAQIRSPLWVARTRCDYGRALQRRGAHAQALPLLRQALATSRELGLPALKSATREPLSAHRRVERGSLAAQNSPFAGALAFHQAFTNRPAAKRYFVSTAFERPHVRAW